VQLDTSNSGDGYFYIRYTGDNQKVKLQIFSDTSITYTYNIAPGVDTVIPFNLGSGEYSLTVYENIQDNEYAMVYAEDMDIKLNDELKPFLYPNQYVWFTAESDTTALAKQLTDGCTNELEAVGKVYDYMIKKGVAKETEKQEAILAIKAKYAGYQTTSERDQQKGSQMLKVASDAAKQELDNTGGTDTPFLGTIQQYQTTMEKLKQLYGNDKENHAAYLAAKQQATAQFCQDLASQMQAAYNSVNQIMSAASSYFSAQQEYETDKVRKKYEKQIEAAGNNQKKVKKLQEKQAKEEAAIKSKYNKRQMVIQMAQAVAQTAINAISAYGAALQIGPLGLTLAPIAAAMAIAAGMLQIAALKKQQQAQEAGYYEGGFTGGRRYRKEAGVVHEGEFVANHQAVNNPNIVPFLNFLDQAQRNNTVGSLTMQDVSRSIGTGGSAQIVTPIVNVQTNNEQLNNTLSQVNESIDMLNQQLLDGINATVAIDGPKGLHKQYTNYLKLINRV
jgi:hypothetical protein